MTTKLELYNGALRICGERPTTLTESREPRRLLDSVWDNQGVDACLENGQWKFAMRSVKLDFDTDFTKDFGYNRQFTKPSDWVLTSSVCSDEYFSQPLTQYSDEAGQWYAEIDTIYVRYVSNDSAYGTDYARWPGTFVDYVSAAFAHKIIFKLTKEQSKRDEVKKTMEQYLSLAKNKDAFNGPPLFPPAGSFVRSRSRLNSDQQDRGNRGSLLG